MLMRRVNPSELRLMSWTARRLKRSGATVTGGAQPEHQVGGDIAAVQRLEAEAVCDAVV
jgi:hypothetical protein